MAGRALSRPERADRVRVTMLGVRGSTAAPGPDFVRYGGHTSCLALAADATSAPVLALDAGTGLRALTGLLGGAPFRGSIVLSHLHWDHVQGIPFFAAGDRPDAQVEVFLPAQGDQSGRDLLALSMSPPSFPITPEGLKGTWSFHATTPGRFSTAGFDLLAFEVKHKGGRTYGYRVQRGASSIAYLPDHAPAAGVAEETMAAIQGVDVLIHDAQFLDHERPRAVDYGHATIDEAVTLAERAEVGTLILYHHGPHRVDSALDTMAEVVPSRVPQQVAFEGMIVDLP